VKWKGVVEPEKSTYVCKGCGYTMKSVYQAFRYRFKCGNCGHVERAE